MITKEFQKCMEACTEAQRKCREALMSCLVEGRELDSSLVKLLMCCAEICKSCADVCCHGSDQCAEMFDACCEVSKRCAMECEKTGESMLKDCIMACQKASECCKKCSVVTA